MEGWDGGGGEEGGGCGGAEGGGEGGGGVGGDGQGGRHWWEGVVGRCADDGVGGKSEISLGGGAEV